MNDDQSEPLRLLVQRITRHQQEACQQILETARLEADDIIALAEAEAKRREALVTEAEEGRLAETEATLRARQATEVRQHRLHQTQAMLEQGWTLLLAQLTQRWADAGQRALWLATLRQRAEQTLAPGDWSVHHPPAWNPAEWGASSAAVAFHPDEHLTAGLRIGCRGAWLDGSLQGMMANRRELSARLLAQLEKDEAYP